VDNLQLDYDGNYYEEWEYYDTLNYKKYRLRYCTFDSVQRFYLTPASDGMG
jgi:hypothetical protein